MSERLSLLIVDDEQANLQKLRRTFLGEYQVLEARSGEEALELLAGHPIAAIITDQKMPGMTGVELLKKALEVRPEAVRIILTGYTHAEDLMDAINQGHVHRYITKPWEPGGLCRQVAEELRRWELERERERLAVELQAANEELASENLKLRRQMQWLGEDGKQLVFKSQAMRELLGLLDRVVATDSTVLIQGETGTGKELLARYIHEKSPRSRQAFVPVNCGAVPRDLVESAFFGHRKGAFTGASRDRQGYFELADRGTLFLDEIGEAPLELQVKLLRVLQEGEVFPVGAQRARRVNTRIIASTNRPLLSRVEEGKFRQDLFFRLNVFSVLVPPLRARQEDIEVLARFFLSRSCERLNKRVADFDPATLELLTGYDWPGNVRELENEVERMVILCEEGCTIAPHLTSQRVRYPCAERGRGRLKEELAELEQRLILDALRECGHNKSQAAQRLGITRQTIIAKLKRYQRQLKIR